MMSHCVVGKAEPGSTFILDDDGFVLLELSAHQQHVSVIKMNEVACVGLNMALSFQSPPKEPRFLCLSSFQIIFSSPFIY